MIVSYEILQKPPWPSVKKVMAEQTAAMAEEIDTLKDELRTLKKTTTTV